MSSSKAKKEKNKQSRNRNLIYLDDFCADHGFEKEFITDYQVRVTHNKTVIDVYPTNQKYCVLFDKGAKSAKWGIYMRVEDLLKYLN